MASDKYQIDMCNGPLFRKIILFTLPLIATAALQQLFSAADLIMVGRYSSHQDMAAVGSCLPLCGLIVNIFFGISVGAGVLTANGIGAKDKLLITRSIHTAMCVAGTGGVILMVIGMGTAYPLLKILDTPDDVMTKALLYMFIYCIGLAPMSLYAYGAAILRAVGDTRRPLYYLIFSGVINVVFNYIFVVWFSMGVVGVGLATMISFIISCILVIRAMTEMTGVLKLKKKLLKIDWQIFRKMLWIGLPAGIQGCFFAISNCVIQGAINSFGSAAMAGNAAALNIETILYSICFSFNQAATSFAGQNMGAKKYSRVSGSAVQCVLASVLFVGFAGVVCTVFGREILAVYNPDPTVVRWGMERALAVFISYAVLAAVDSTTGTLRGMGQSIAPMILTLFGVCLSRILWVWVVFPMKRTMTMLMLSYPVSYIITIILTGTLLWFSLKKLTSSTSVSYGAATRI